jgi:sulfate/thiosulfate transport system ATP-binding protein
MGEVNSIDYTDSGKESLAGAMWSAISLKHISKRFGAQPVLTDISLDIAAGELFVVLGTSGSGKTTLLRIVAGLEQADSGEVLLNGNGVNHLPPQARKMGVVFQDHALFRYMSVEQNIAFGLRLRKTTRAKVRGRVNDLLKMVRLETHHKKYPHQLSGGERQRVAIARALAYSPSAALLDEPFSALDPITRTELRRDVRRLLKQMNVPALFITHDQEEALEMGDRIAIMNNGHIEQIGTPHEIYNYPGNEFVATFLGAANVLLGQWHENRVMLGALRLKATPDAPVLSERQPVKVVFRPEDVVINFQRQLLDTPFYLGNGIVEDISYVGPTERLTVQLQIWPSTNRAAEPINTNPRLMLVDETYAESFPIRISRTKWEASEMELSPGDPVVLGLKHYLLLPHYPLQSESAAKLLR